MKTRKQKWGLVLSAIAALGAGCSTTKSAVGMEQSEPKISAARLQGIPDSQLTEVHQREQELQKARQIQQQAKTDADGIRSRLDYAKTNLDLAKAESKAAKQRSEISSREVTSGTEQRAAQEAPPTPEAQPSPEAQPAPEAQPSQPTTTPQPAAKVSDLRAAELKEEAAKNRVQYLETLQRYAKSRENVGSEAVKFAQAQLDNAQYVALEKARPDEARSLKQKEIDFRSAVTQRQADLTKARADMEKGRADAMARYDQWNKSYQNLPDADRGEQPPAPDTLPPL